MSGRFIFTQEYGPQRVSVEIDGDSNLSDALDAVETFLIAAGFDRKQVLAGMAGSVPFPDSGTNVPKEGT
jgi:hypothetical protein